MDSEKDTLKHIKRVSELLALGAIELLHKAKLHDKTKLEDPEKAVFDEFTPKLATSTYGSDEYKGFLAEMKPALDHHYAKNRHHPEHFENGIDGMDLFDLVEMLFDWKAATERHNNGDILKSLDINETRFNISPQLKQVLINTVNNFF